MGGPSRAIESGQVDDVARGLARRGEGPVTLLPSERSQSSVHPAEPRMRGPILDRVVARAQALLADPSQYLGTFAALRPFIVAHGLQPPRLNSYQPPTASPEPGHADHLGAIVGVFAQRPFARHILRQLAALSEHCPALDLHLVVMIATRESHLDRTYLLGTNTRTLDVHTYRGGGIDNLGAALNRGVDIPPRYRTPPWEALPPMQTNEGAGTVTPARVPSGHLWVAYGVYLESLRTRYLIPRASWSTLTPLHRRFFAQLAFGGVTGHGHVTYARNRRGREPAWFGLRTVTTWLATHGRGRPIETLLRDTAILSAMHSEFNHSHRYRRAWITAFETQVFEMIHLIPGRMLLVDV